HPTDGFGRVRDPHRDRRARGPAGRALQHQCLPDLLTVSARPVHLLVARPPQRPEMVASHRSLLFRALGTDPIEELTNLAEKIYSEFPHSIFFTSKLIFERDNWYIRQLHSEAALTMLRRLHLRNMPMVILPMKL